MTARTRRTIVVVGWGLVGLIAASVFAVAIIATLEGSGGFGIASNVTGRPGIFTPVVYIPLLVAALIVGALWVLRKVSKPSNGPEASNSTPHADAREARRSADSGGPRAGERGR